MRGHRSSEAHDDAAARVSAIVSVLALLSLSPLSVVLAIAARGIG